MQVSNKERMVDDAFHSSCHNNDIVVGGFLSHAILVGRKDGLSALLFLHAIDVVG